MKTYLALAAMSLLIACSNDEPVSVTEVSEVEIDASAADQDDVIQAESARLNAWFDEQFEERLQFSPQMKTRLGDKSDYDRLDEVSEAARLEQLEWMRTSVSHMRNEFDFNRLNPDTQLSWELWVHNLELSELGQNFWRHGYIFGRGGPHASLPNFLINYHQVDTAEDAQAYISRIGEIPRVFAQLLERAEQAALQGIRQPRFAYQFAIDEIGRITAGAPFNEGDPSPLWSDFQSKIQALVDNQIVEQSQADSLLSDARELLSSEVREAYQGVLTWLQTDMAQTDELATGVWQLPDGEAYYNYRLYLMTALDISADEIHQIGLDEVDRLQEEMRAILESVNFAGTLQEFFVFMREGEQFYFPNTDEGRQSYLDLATDYLSTMDEKLPEYFGRLPKASLEVRRVEAFREQDGGSTTLCGRFSRWVQARCFLFSSV